MFDSAQSKLNITWVLIELLAKIENQISNRERKTSRPPRILNILNRLKISHILNILINRFRWIWNFPFPQDRFLISSYGTFHKLDWSFNLPKCLFTRPNWDRRVSYIFDKHFMLDCKILYYTNIDLKPFLFRASEISQKSWPR